MRLREFVRKNRPRIDSIIRAAVTNRDFTINDLERELWVANDYELYTEWQRTIGKTGTNG